MSNLKQKLLIYVTAVAAGILLLSPSAVRVVPNATSSFTVGFLMVTSVKMCIRDRHYHKEVEVKVPVNVVAENAPCGLSLIHILLVSD